MSIICILMENQAFSRSYDLADLDTLGLEALEACALRRLANTADLGTVNLEVLEACALRLANTVDMGT